MKQMILGAALVGIGTVIGAISSDDTNGTANAQFAPPMQSGDALWHLPQFGDKGWFLHASNGRVELVTWTRRVWWANEQPHVVQSGQWIDEG